MQSFRHQPQPDLLRNHGAQILLDVENPLALAVVFPRLRPHLDLTTYPYQIGSDAQLRALGADGPEHQVLRTELAANLSG
jgi:hypothetical protein